MLMKAKRILFFSSEPGGAEVLCPVIRLLQEHAYEVVVIAYGHGAERFDKQGIPNCTMRVSSADTAWLTIRDVKPDYLITSATSLPWIDMSERYLWEAANRYGVGSLAFLDQWQNYSVRFSGPLPHEQLRYLPDYINCINEIGRREMIAEGFPVDRLISLGHPYLTDIAARYSILNQDDVVMALGIAPSNFIREETLVFVSEPLFENFGNSRGYNQYDVLAFFLTNVHRFRRNTHVVLKLHPKDELHRFQGVLGLFPEIEIHVVQNELSSLECLTLSNRIFGMTSIMLIEAFLLGKTVVSLQPGLIIDDPLVLSRYGLIPRLGVLEDFNVFAFEDSRPSTFLVDFDKSRFIDFIDANIKLAPHFTS
jgi:hypothetical protein